MQSVIWNSFGLHSEKTRTLVHFFPSAGGLTAPYPAQCRLTAFGPPLGVKSVTLDGGRVSQPDGICIEDVFASLENEKSLILGLTIELVTMQPRLDIEPSSCVVEFVTDGYSTRFHPVSGSGPSAADEDNNPEGGKRAPLVGVALKDKFTSTSLVAVNAGEEEVQLPLRLLKNDKTEPSTETVVVAPSSAREFHFADMHYKDAFAMDQSFGTQASLPIIMDPVSFQNVALYFMFRDASTGCPVSVCRL